MAEALAAAPAPAAALLADVAAAADKEAAVRRVVAWAAQGAALDGEAVTVETVAADVSVARRSDLASVRRSGYAADQAVASIRILT